MYWFSMKVCQLSRLNMVLAKKNVTAIIQTEFFSRMNTRCRRCTWNKSTGEHRTSEGGTRKFCGSRKGTWLTRRSTSTWLTSIIRSLWSSITGRSWDSVRYPHRCATSRLSAAVSWSWRLALWILCSFDVNFIYLKQNCVIRINFILCVTV